MQYSYQAIVKRWIPILKEYERTKAKVNPRSFKFIKDICKAHHISSKELRRYYVKWIQGNKLDEALLPNKRGVRPGSRGTPKEVERNIVTRLTEDSAQTDTSLFFFLSPTIWIRRLHLLQWTG